MKNRNQKNTHTHLKLKIYTFKKEKSKIVANHLESKHIFKTLYVGYRQTCSYHVKTLVLK